MILMGIAFIVYYTKWTIPNLEVIPGMFFEYVLSLSIIFLILLNTWFYWLVLLSTFRESFPNDLQFNILMRFTVDQTQTPSLKVKNKKVKSCECIVPIENYYLKLCWYLHFCHKRTCSMSGSCFYKLSESQASTSGPASLFLELQGFCFFI